MPSLSPCPQCKGTGKVPLTEVLQATLGAVSINGKATAAQLYEFDDWDGVGITALNNRLEDLRRLGFLERRHTHGGKGWTYFLPKKQTKTEMKG